MTRTFDARTATPAALLLALFLAACGGSDQDGASSTAEDAADQAREAVNEATDAAGDMADDAAQATQDAAEDLARSTEDAAEDAMAATEEAADQVAGAADEAMDEATDEMDQAAESATQAAAAAAGAGAAASAAAAAAEDDDPCTLGIEVGDNIAYSTDTLSAPASCAEVTVSITHTGRLPAAAMGHNWVLVPEDALESVAQAGMSAGADAGYVPDDDRVVAATGIVGGGESDSVSFSLDALQDGVTYRYVCTFPGHWMVMQGTFTVSG